jgi:hypothetical protein
MGMYAHFLSLAVGNQTNNFSLCNLTTSEAIITVQIQASIENS